jgi:transposase InsO family protein
MLGYSKQAYYKRLHQMEEQKLQESLVVDLAKKKRKIWKKGSGRNLFAALQRDFEKHSIKIGRDKFYKVLRENNLLVQKRKCKARTTFSYHHYHKYPNIAKCVVPQGPGELIVSDIKYIWVKDVENFAYLFLVTDVYSRKIIGYCLSENLKAIAAVRALKMGIRQIPRPELCIHHSDKGIQYCCFDYTGLLKKYRIQISMTENGDPLENPIAERVNKTIKEEFTDEATLSFSSFKEGKKQIAKIIKFYNSQRPHRSIEMLTPDQAYKMSGELKRLWKTYYKKDKINVGDFS